MSGCHFSVMHFAANDKRSVFYTLPTSFIHYLLRRLLLSFHSIMDPEGKTFLPPYCSDEKAAEPVCEEKVEVMWRGGWKWRVVKLVVITTVGAQAISSRVSRMRHRRTLRCDPAAVRRAQYSHVRSSESSRVPRARPCATRALSVTDTKGSCVF